MNRTRTAKFAALGALLALAFALPYMVGEYYISLASMVVISAILASSINMLAGDAGLVSLGHAGIAAASGYGLAWASRQDYDLWVQLAVAAAMTLLVSALFGLVSMRTRGVFFLMVTLAAGMICYGIAYRWSDVTGGDNGLTGIRRPEIIAPYWNFYFLVLGALVVVTVLVLIVSRSPFGLVLRGIRDSESRMRSVGYNITAYKFAAMMLSGTVAGAAGAVFVWHAEFVSPAIGDFNSSALALIMVVLGGIGTVSGPILGATTVVLIEQALSTYVDRWMTVLGVLLIASVLFAPQGLAGGIRQAAAGALERVPRKVPAVPQGSAYQRE
ncbi:branched-chain amino acid ABC transporter permease [Actinobacteria bacterium YIM 96077]|uniref:Branched-chain amino acid ABC transporter permease n=1 Tax=Phytoactinopolyspora halophila TaxID=1981511 RepID=A0A329R1R0_9ACTN|nr:branched-chain amino acid ABC transporter permease [Phytoactinopolyspora halophila]AYY13343.1 branched-chain amino acid ABC transporter permease [Actinobacteria bacterium YIM 96077]RAW17422.1 branched-chain amino acid ABC transporter permease [Phytoactinopolyspora halophila]